jgi:hypothetical protein
MTFASDVAENLDLYFYDADDGVATTVTRSVVSTSRGADGTVTRTPSNESISVIMSNFEAEEIGASNGQIITGDVRLRIRQALNIGDRITRGTESFSVVALDTTSEANGVVIEYIYQCRRA